jgi:hypothetical protein
MARSIIPRMPPQLRAPKLDPDKVIFKPPRLKPISTREYGKGGTPLSGAPDMGLRGAGIGYGIKADGP